MEQLEKHNWTPTRLVEAILQGDPTMQIAMTYIYQEWRKPITASYRFYIPNLAIREDIFSESFIDFILAIQHGCYDVSKQKAPRNYLWSIYRNKIFSWLRTGTVGEGNSDDVISLPFPEEGGFDEHLFSIQAWQQFESVFKSLAQEHQEVLGMKYGVYGWEPKSVKEIAQYLGKTPKNASNYIIRCQGRLFRALIKSKNPGIHDLILKELEDPTKIMLLDEYWEKANQVLRYLEKDMNEEEEGQYELEKQQDPQFTFFEDLVKKWGRTRVSVEQDGASQLSNSSIGMVSDLFINPLDKIKLRNTIHALRKNQLYSLNS